MILILTESDTFSSLFCVRASERNMSRHVQYAIRKMRQCNRCSIRIFCVYVRCICVYVRCISVKWILIPHVLSHIWLNFNGKNLKSSPKVAMSVSYNLSKVEDASIFLHEIKNILVCLLYTSPSPRD